MNYPLRGQDQLILCSNIDEPQLCALTTEDIKNLHSTSNTIQAKEDDMKEPEELKELMEYLSPEEIKVEVAELPTEIKNKEELDNFWSNNTISLGLGKHTIITIIRSPYLSSKIIIRNLTGVHAWLLKEHRVLEYNCLNSLDYDDRTSLYKNILMFNQKIKNIKEIKSDESMRRQFQEAIRLEPVNDLTKIENDVKKREDNDHLLMLISIVAKHHPNIKTVYLTMSIGKKTTRLHGKTHNKRTWQED